MRIYLAGKIAGDPGYREKFQKAQARLFQKIGDDARKYRFEPRQLPK